MKRSAWILGLCLPLLLALAAPVPAVAQQPDSAAEKRAAQEKAREARIQEYLRKKEERRARREAEAKRKDEEAAAKRTADAMAKEESAARGASVAAPPAGTTARTKPDTVAAGEKAARKQAQADRRKAKKEQRASTRTAVRSALPRGLAKIHAGLRVSDFGQDPTVAKYLDLIESGAASAQQIAAFGNFLGQAGRPETALAYYDLALGLDDTDTTIWLNAGTLQRQAGNLKAAAGAYVQVLGLDPDHAHAHYNLGAVLDEIGEYDAAIEEYKLALAIDPTLGDPAVNPQAANNEKLTAVFMMLYKEQAGSLGLPLVTIPDGEVEDEK